MEIFSDLNSTSKFRTLSPLQNAQIRIFRLVWDYVIRKKKRSSLNTDFPQPFGNAVDKKNNLKLIEANRIIFALVISFVIDHQIFGKI